MSVRNTLTGDQVALFEKDLLSALVRDRDHQFAFDGVLQVYSSRYDCVLRAVNVHWDEKKGDVVFVGAFLKGKPQFDLSRGYPVVAQELSIPFRECFEDLRRTPGYQESYLLSKVRKAVIEKCLVYPAGRLSTRGLAEEGKIAFGEFPFKSFAPDGGRNGVGELSVSGGTVSVTDGSGRPMNLSRMSLSDIQRIGEDMLRMNDIMQDAFKVYHKGYYSVVKEGSTVPEADNARGAMEGLRLVREMGYPPSVCKGLARTYFPSAAGLFESARSSVGDIDRLIEAFREGRVRMGSSVKVSELKTGQNKI